MCRGTNRGGQNEHLFVRVELSREQAGTGTESKALEHRELDTNIMFTRTYTHSHLKLKSMHYIRAA